MSSSPSTSLRTTDLPVPRLDSYRRIWYSGSRVARNRANGTPGHYSMDESQEQELWRLRGVDIDLDSARLKIKELEDHIVRIRHIESAAAAIEQREQALRDEYKKLQEIHDKTIEEFHDLDYRYKIVQEQVGQLRRQLEEEMNREYMDETYGFKITGDLPKRQGWRKSR